MGIKVDGEQITIYLIYFEKGKNMRLKKEWNNVEGTTKLLMEMFNIWKVSNLRITKEKDRTLNRTFGFPYTSSSEYAAIWNCQAEALYRWNPEWRFEALAVSENNDAIAVFEHEDETERNFNRMYVIIGKVID